MGTAAALEGGGHLLDFETFLKCLFIFFSLFFFSLAYVFTFKRRSLKHDYFQTAVRRGERDLLFVGINIILEGHLKFSFICCEMWVDFYFLNIHSHQGMVKSYIYINYCLELYVFDEKNLVFHWFPVCVCQSLDRIHI